MCQSLQFRNLLYRSRGGREGGTFFPIVNSPTWIRHPTRAQKTLTESTFEKNNFFSGKLSRRRRRFPIFIESTQLKKNLFIARHTLLLSRTSIPVICASERRTICLSFPFSFDGRGEETSFKNPLIDTRKRRKSGEKKLIYYSFTHIRLPGVCTIIELLT